MRGRKSSDADIDLGLAISGALLEPNQIRTHEELAAYCGVSHTAIQMIERVALRKMRIRLEERGVTSLEVRELSRLLTEK